MNLFQQKTRFILHIITAFTASILVCGCMVGPKYQRPPTLADAAKSYVYAEKTNSDVNDANCINMWWQRFGDVTINDLVEQALSSNFDLQAAAARVLGAEAVVSQISGQQWPDVSYGLNRTRGKSSLTTATGARYSNLATTVSQNISVSYIVDLFGKLKHQRRGAWADLLAAKANQQALVHAVISNVVKARVNIATIQRSLIIARSNTKNWQSNLVIIERRYNSGLADPIDVRLAKENLANSRAAEIVIELNLAKAENGLDVLLGRRPGSGGVLALTLGELPDLDAVGLDVPARLLDRRPDVRAAELLLESANEQVGVSIANMYPDLTLSGSYGNSADRWRDIWIGETEIYSAVVGLSQPRFKGGQLKAKVKAAKARYLELAANYAKTVSVAMREVEDALVGEQLRQRLLKELESRFEHAAAAEKLAMDRYLRGVESLIVVLDIERRRRIVENELVITKGNLWSGRVDIFLAIGGDWTGQEINN